jgi:hypothetical protein
MRQQLAWTVLTLVGLLTGCEGGSARLVEAIRQDNARLTEKYMSDKSIDVNGRDRHGMSPLLQALRSKNKSVFADLLQRGADPML